MGLILRGNRPEPSPDRDGSGQFWRLDRRLAELDFGAASLVTIDVFDTLVFRDCHRPEIIFARVAETALQSGDLAPGIGIEGFVEARRTAETRARDQSRRERSTGEVTLARIYTQISQAVGAASRLEALERGAERAAMVPNPFVLDLLHALKAEGRRVWLVSDMYLEGSDLAHLLTSAGIDRRLYDRLIVSSDHGESKREGGLFRIVAEESGVPPNHILHIGDNPVGDVATPRRLGIEALHYPMPPATAETVRRERLLGAPQMSLHTNARGLAEALCPHDEAAPFWFSYGATVIGPIADAYAEWVVDRSAALGIDRILPFMREGKLLARLMRRHVASKGYAIGVTPLHVSRQALRLPSITELDDATLDGLATTSLVRTLGNLLEQFAIADRPRWLEPWSRHRLIDLVAAPDADGNMVWPLAKKWLMSDCKAGIEARAAAARGLAEAYVRGVLNGTRRIATVDLGARGTTQTMLAGLPGLEDQVSMEHFLFYGVRSIASHRLNGARFHLFMPETAESYEVAELLHRASHFLEILLCGNERTTIGYRRRADGGVEPVLGAMVEARDQIAAIDACWRGIDAYVEAAGLLAPAGIPIDRAEILAIAHRAVHLPTVAEAQMLGGLSYDFNDGTDCVRRITDGAALDRVASLDIFRPEARLKMALQCRQTDLPWPQGAITERTPDAILRLIEGARTSFGHDEICRHLLDRVEAMDTRVVLLYAAGGAGGMGPCFIRLARERGIEVAGYLDHLPGMVAGDFEGVPVLEPCDLPGHPVRTLVVCSTGYGTEIIATVGRLHQASGGMPDLVTLTVPPP